MTDTTAQLRQAQLIEAMQSVIDAAKVVIDTKDAVINQQDLVIDKLKEALKIKEEIIEDLLRGPNGKA